MPGKFYEVAITNLGELNAIFKEITQDGWAIDPDETWANAQLRKYQEFFTSEKVLIDKEIAAFLESKGFGDISKLIVRGKAELELSSKIHEARFPVLIKQLISERQRQIDAQTKTDTRWTQEQWIRNGSIILLFVSAGINLWTTQFTRKTYALAEKSNERTQRLFIGEDNPQVQAIPYAIGEAGATHNSTLNFHVINHSGFDAFDINIDVQYCVDKGTRRHWAGEWIKADKDSSENKGAAGAAYDKGYFFAPLHTLERLERFKEIDTDKQDGFYGSNALNLESQVCSKDKEGLPVLVRLRWRNEKKRAYDEIRKYKLLCTKNWMGASSAPKGRAFTMVPLPGSTCE